MLNYNNWKLILTYQSVTYIWTISFNSVTLVQLNKTKYEGIIKRN